MNKTFGYSRVSTLEQNLDMQVDALLKEGCKKEDIFTEKASGKNTTRPQLEKLKELVRAGDTVVVWKLDRISRSTKHLLELSQFFEDKEVNLISIKDKIDTSTAMGKFYFTMIAAIAQLEADIISERTLAGLASARSRGKLGGRKRINPSKVKNAIELYDTQKYTIAEITEMTGVKKPTLYKYLNERKEDESNKA
ncbi:recombinase family protein [Bacillus timonensis]|uniref:recombinase family protein n=1 Tax=Bacillus timonensis TaxID=1033734 RepID=UPI000287F836|nr:recombinase family protein [Bacillus timonensis]